MKGISIWLISLLLIALMGRESMAQSDDSAGIYGQKLMSPQERQNYREKLWDLKTEADRNRFRQRHHGRMQERARYEGVTLPKSPWFIDRTPQWLREKDNTEQKKSENRWPEDGLRRWDPAGQDSALKRWPPQKKDREGGPDDGLRRWPAEQARAEDTARRSQPESFKGASPQGRTDGR